MSNQKIKNAVKSRYPEPVVFISVCTESPAPDQGDLTIPLFYYTGQRQVSS